MSTFQLVLLGLLIAVIFCDKRQGVFAPCQGWGAGCTSYHSYRPIPQPPTRKITRNVHKTPSYMFTSGSSWKPIGKRRDDTKKRTSWFTDIPYLRNPFLSYPRLKSGSGSRINSLHRVVSSQRQRQPDLVEV
ncbi:uncharacterized protein LOC133196245 [Saccostrea echinata]|uniref:uncharacterized protein LOC133196245 n=1 Tax=Saccostrea echinata TaxID=191078 RepID=UPI002A8211A1|nr:uncharacterized protein LOC133196245 [Saccostrea echinata]